MVCGTRLEPQAVLLPLASPMGLTLGLARGPTLGQATAHERLTSHLRKRGEPPRVVGGAADAKAKGPIERKYAPEEVCHRLLASVKARAQEVLGREVRHRVYPEPRTPNHCP